MVEVFTRRLLTLTEGNVVLAIDFYGKKATNFTIEGRFGSKVKLDPSEFEDLKLLITEYVANYKEGKE